MKCPNCGIETEGKFCDSCGAALTQAEEKANVKEEQSQTADKVKAIIKKPIFKKWWFWVIIGVVTLMLIGLISDAIKKAAENNKETPYSVAEGAEAFNVELHIDFVENLAMNKYNLVFKIDSAEYCTLTHGTDQNLKIPMTAGQHTLSFIDVENENIKGEVIVYIDGDTTLSYTVSNHSDMVKIEKNESASEKTTDGGSAAPEALSAPAAPTDVKYTDVEFSGIKYSVPEYFEQGKTDTDKVQFFSSYEKTGSSALFKISVSDVENMTEESFNSSKTGMRDAMVKDLIDKKVSECTTVNIAGYPAFTFTVSAVLKDSSQPFTSKYLLYLDEAAGKCGFISVSQTDNCKYEYLTAFDKIVASAEKVEAPAKDDSFIDPELKAALDSYESFVDDYVAFMKKYYADPNNALYMMGDYFDMLEKLEDFEDKLDAYDESTMTKAESDYYDAVMLRCAGKLASFAITF